MKRFLKIIFKIFAVLLVLLLFLSVLFSSSKVQNYVAKRVSNYINNKYNTDINIKKVNLSYIGQVKLEDVFIKDTQKDTIIYVKDLNTSFLKFGGILKGEIPLSKILLSDFSIVMRTYLGEKENELTKFVKKFNTEKKTKKPSQFLLSSNQLILEKGRFKIINENKKETPVVVFYKEIYGKINDFKIEGSDISAALRDVQFVDIKGLKVKNLATDFSYSSTNMNLLNTRIQTLSSHVVATIKLNYEAGGFSDFVNKVHIDAVIPEATISLRDLKIFYDKLGSKDVIKLSSNVKGTLNDLTTENLKISFDKKTKVNGNLRFINGFNSEKEFQLIADIKKIESDYNHLKRLLPNIIGKALPESFKHLGHFIITGKTNVTNDLINAKLKIQSDIGVIQSDLKIRNFKKINQATYQGQISLQDIKLGELIADPLVGEFSMNADVMGKGFTLEHLDTQINGVITKHQYKGYTYQDISIEGRVKDKLFSGEIDANDPNIKFDFEGLADLSKEKYKFDFTMHVDHANFNKLHLFKRDSIAILKGDIKIAMIGNTLENMDGSIQFNNAIYTNQIQDYNFKDFTITSAVKDSIQTLMINSTDIVNGRLSGRFVYKDLMKLAQNAFGSIYTNYKPYEVSPKQFLDFRFKIHNQVIAVFFPEIKFGKKTEIRGEINSDEHLFRLTFKSPEVLAYNNLVEKIQMQIDNQNPLFNTQLSVESVKTKFYDIADLNLVNITLNDTLHFRTEFRGGKDLKDEFSLAFYHTINQQHQSILGFQKSALKINNLNWKINPKNDSKNKLIYDVGTGEINFDDFLMVAGEQEILFYGKQQGKKIQNYNIDLERIDLTELTSGIKNFDFKGMINGGIWIEKRNNILVPTVDIQILDFYVNDKLQGDLIGEIKGSNSHKKYLINISMEKNEFKNFLVEGAVDFSSKKPTIDLDLNFNKFQLDILGALTKGSMENLRGEIIGKANIKGLLKNPDFSGELSLNKTGVTIPYINVDYALVDDSKILLNNKSFIIKDTELYDTLYNTTGRISGSILHQSFKNWALDIKIDTENLLAVNTTETEESLFFGTGYLKGNATLKGEMSSINIAINGSSNPGTDITIPMSDLKTAEASRLIYFKVPKTDDNTLASNWHKEIADLFKGVTMDFDLGITKDATLKIIIDKTTGSYIQGNGTGTIRMDIDTKGTFKMFGDFIVDKGIYSFKYGGIINKSFIVNKGGSISFTGDPTKAELDIEAVYKVKASPKVLLPEYESNRKIPVELIAKITGELFNSRQKFDIKIPNASLDLSTELRFILNDNDTGNMMRQFVSLLALGNFIGENVSNAGSMISNEVGASAYKAISNALLNIFSNSNDKLQFGFDYTQGNKIIDTENQLGISVATRLGKNEKIIINGEVNLPTGSQSNAHIAGSVSVELPLNKKETLMMKVFNRQNEIQYTDQEEGYTQGMGLSWHVDFDDVKELLRKMGLKKDQKKEPVKQDSIPREQSRIFLKPQSDKSKVYQN